jgi:hypothetical protein
MQESNLVANTRRRAVIEWPLACTSFKRLDLVGDSGAVCSMENDDFLENWLKDATAEDLRQLVEDFLNAFFLDKLGVAMSRRALKEDAQDGRGVHRHAERTGEFLCSLAERSRALCASGHPDRGLEEVTFRGHMTL